MNHDVGLIVKTEPEMTGIYRWVSDLRAALEGRCLYRSYEVSSRTAGLVGVMEKHLVDRLGRAMGRDLSTARKNYPTSAEIPRGDSCRVWHLTSQTFGALVPHLPRKGFKLATIFDLYPAIHRIYGSFTDRKGYLRSLSALSGVDGVVTLTEAAADEIEHMLGMPRSRIHVVYPGISSAFHPVPGVQRNPLEIVYVGSELPRKNLRRLLGALPAVFAKHPGARFTKVGRSQWAGSRKELEEYAVHLGISAKVRFLDYVEDLPALYSASGVVVQASTHEGFGYPVVEAMACGAPIVASDIPSLREVARGAAALVDPLSTDSIAQGILRAFNESAALSEKSKAVAAHYTQERFADAMNRLYRQVA